MNINVQELISAGIKFLTEYGPKVLSAVLVLWIGFRVISRSVIVIDKIMKHNKVDTSLRSFLESLFEVGLKILVVISAASMLGIQTTSFVAVLGAAGLAVGLALQGSLSNFAGGALILFFKPYKVGDFVEAQGEMGTVQKIQILNTLILNPDNKTIIVPNGAIANGNIINYSSAGKIRMDISVGISYDASIKEARDVILKALKGEKRILNTPETTVAVSELADSSVNLIVRPWCKPDDYWALQLECLETIKEALDKANIEIPFPQRVIHMQK